MNSTTLGVSMLILAVLVVAVVVTVYYSDGNITARKCKRRTKRKSMALENTIILLTCTVTVSNVDCLEQRDIQERKDTYKTSVRKWIAETPFRVVTVENSGFNMSAEWLGFDKTVYKKYERISFNEQTDDGAADVRDNTSKGIHEMYAIQRAFEESSFLKQALFVIKVTGRFFLPSLYDVLYDSALTQFNAIRQHSPDECQVIGVKARFAKHLFSTQDAHAHVEATYKSRLEEPWTKGKVLVLPLMPIPLTRTGGHGTFIDVL